MTPRQAPTCPRELRRGSFSLTDASIILHHPGQGSIEGKGSCFQVFAKPNSDKSWASSHQKNPEEMAQTVVLTLRIPRRKKNEHKKNGTKTSPWVSDADLVICWGTATGHMVNALCKMVRYGCCDICPSSGSRLFIFPLKTRSRYVTQTGLTPAIFLPQPSECWDYSCAPLHLASNFLLPWLKFFPRTPWSIFLACSHFYNVIKKLAHIQNDVAKRLLTKALFVVAKHGKQLKYPSMQD
jgi:hypothetical protein